MELFENDPGNTEICAFTFCAEIIGPVGEAFFKNGDKAFCAVIHVDPVSNLLAGAIDRNRKISQSVVDDCRNEFFEMLARAVGVGAARDNNVLTVCGVSSLDHEVGTRLAGGVGGRGANFGRLIELVGEEGGAVDFIGRALKK